MAAGVSAAARRLGLWEEASHRLAPERAVLFAHRADPGLDPDAVARLPLGDRDRLVLALRTQVVDGPLVALADCPACGAQLELEIAPEALLAGPRPDRPAPAERVVTDGSVVVRVRAPTSIDVLAAVGAGDEEAALHELLRRCVLEARDGDRPLTHEDLGPGTRGRIDDALAELDPDAILEVALTCGDCGHAFVRGLDPGELLVLELAAAGRRTLREVHVLAGAYGWSESEILGLGERRRHWYLELAAG